MTALPERLPPLVMEPRQVTTHWQVPWRPRRLRKSAEMLRLALVDVVGLVGDVCDPQVTTGPDGALDVSLTVLAVSPSDASTRARGAVLRAAGEADGELFLVLAACCPPLPDLLI